MEEEEVQQGTRRLIRRFSQDVAENEPNNSLALRLEQATEREEKGFNRSWRRWYEDEDETSAYVDLELSATSSSEKPLIMS